MKQRSFIKIAVPVVFLLSSTSVLSFSNSTNINPDLVNSIVDTIDMDLVRQEIINLSQCIGSVTLSPPRNIDANSPTEPKKCFNNVTSVRAWRLSGTEEELEVVNHVRDSFTSALNGMQAQTQVTTEPVTLDMWRFQGGNLKVTYGPTSSPNTLSFQAASIAGSSITPTIIPQGSSLPAGCSKKSGVITCNYNLSGNLVWVNKGIKSDYDNLVDSNGMLPPNTIVLYSWDDTIDWVSAQCYEAKVHGAKAVIQTTLPELGSFYYYNAENGGGTFDMVGDGSSCPPMITISPKDARTVLNILAPSVLNPKNPTATPMKAEVKLNLQYKENAEGQNVLARITGSTYPHELIIFSGHHDAYFQGAADDEAAIALMIGMAKAIKESGYKPKRTWIFVSVTGEEFGVFGSVYDWLAGSLSLTKRHLDWSNAFNTGDGDFAVAEINVGDVVPAAIGGRIQYSVTHDFLDPANTWFSSLGKDIDPSLVNFIATFVDQYTYYHIAGIPNIGFDQFTLPYYHNYYHTDGDTIDILDFNQLKQVARVNMIAALALDNATTLPYDYDKGISRLKNFLNLATVSQLVSMGAGENLQSCSPGIDASLNTALSAASNANANLQNAKAPTNLTDIKEVNKHLREASRIYSTLSTSDGAITPETTYLHVPSEREVINMNAAIDALQGNNPAPAKALASLLNVTPYVNVFVSHFSQGAFNQRLIDYQPATGFVGPPPAPNPRGPKSSGWGLGSTPAYGFYSEYQSIQNKMAQGNNNFQTEISSIQTKRNDALSYYCGTLNQTLNAVTGLTTSINNAIAAASH